jgi:hypothetical protein
MIKKIVYLIYSRSGETTWAARRNACRAPYSTLNLEAYQDMISAEYILPRAAHPSSSKHVLD